MKILCVRLLFIFLNAVYLILPTQGAYAQSTCQSLFDTATSRAEIKSLLLENNIPAVIAKSANGEIPVILMNSQTGTRLKKFLSESIGTIVAHQPDWKNDHGLFRFGDIIADLDAPGARQRGELHATGISWVSAQSYLQLRARTKRIEVAYSLTKDEMKVVQLYHLMRRAAILRAKFSFRDFKQNTNHLNFLNGGGENCFGFCSASSLSSHIYEIKQQFEGIGLGSLNEVLSRSDVKTWLNRVDNKLSSVNIASPSELSPTLPIQTGVPDSLANSVNFKALSNADKTEALNWLVSANLSIAYEKLTRELGFNSTGSGYNGMNNRRASAVLIYDAETSVNNFLSPNYVSKGIFSTWSNKDTEPL